METWLWGTKSYTAVNYTVKVKVRSLGSLDETGEAETMMSFRLSPLPGDFDEESKADITVWRPDGGGWFTIGSIDDSRSVTGFGSATNTAHSRYGGVRCLFDKMLSRKYLTLSLTMVFMNMGFAKGLSRKLYQFQIADRCLGSASYCLRGGGV